MGIVFVLIRILQSLKRKPSKFPRGWNFFWAISKVYFEWLDNKNENPKIDINEPNSHSYPGDSYLFYAPTFTFWLIAKLAMLTPLLWKSNRRDKIRDIVSLEKWLRWWPIGLGIESVFGKYGIDIEICSFFLAEWGSSSSWSPSINHESSKLGRYLENMEVILKYVHSSRYNWGLVFPGAPQLTSSLWNCKTSSIFSGRGRRMRNFDGFHTPKSTTGRIWRRFY